MGVGPAKMRNKNDINPMKSLSHYSMLFIALTSLAFSSLTSAATMTSTVNRNEIGTNETLTLVVSIDKQVDTSSLDLSPLQENFEVLGSTPQSRSSFNIVNGKSENRASTTWTITLVPKNEGVLTIPAFTVDTETSKAISIAVSNAVKGANSSAPLDVKVSANANQVYQNQQLIVELEISAQDNVGDLKGPQLVIQNADIEVLDQQNFRRVDNGIARQVVLLKYSVFAKEAGEIIIPVMTYTALVNARRRVFGSSGTQVIARSKQLNITVKAPPPNNAQQWFPAEDVVIESKWSGDASNLNVGEPITRIITVTAKGQLASAIPPLDLGVLDANLKSYKDQAQLDTSKSTNGFIATRIESAAIVANRAGNFVLPEVTIEWWNTNTDQWQTSTLEAQSLTITGTAAPINAVAAQTPLNSNQFDTVSNTNNGSKTTWQLISGLLLVVVLVQFFFLTARRRPKAEPVIVNAKGQSEQQAWAVLQSSLKSENSRSIRNSISAWGAVILNVGAPVSLETLAFEGIKAGGSEKLRDVFAALDKHLYRDEEKPQISEIDKLLKEHREKLKKVTIKQSKQSADLKPLYPR